MSTNPFRQTRLQTDVQTASTAIPPIQRPSLSDGSGSRAAERNDLSLDTKVPHDAFERHVSFASPPVDSTIPAASYPSSPESIRSPPGYFGPTAALYTPDYRSAIQSDPFEDLRRDQQEDGTLQQAVSNAQTNMAVGQPPAQPERPQERAVWDTLSRFASGPSRPPPSNESIVRPPVKDDRKSLDVDAFKRLLLTGDSENGDTKAQHTVRRPAPPPPRNNTAGGSNIQTGPDTTSDHTSPPISNLSELDTKRASFLDSLVQPGHKKASLDAQGKLPPPAPAPRRAKSVKTRDLSPLPMTKVDESASPAEELSSTLDRPSKKPPAPPLARRQSQRIPSNRSDDSLPTPSPTASPAEPAKPSAKSAANPPPPPPVRRLPPASVRRASQELAPTIEEPEADIAVASGSRRSSNDQTQPPGSRKTSLTTRQPNPGLMAPPPLPPPRKGRGSSRSSIDSFRPSMATLMGDEAGQENANSADQPRRASAKDRSSLNPSNADSILAELANLQKEVDAARRG